MARALRRLAAFLAGSFVLIGVLHMPFARDLLRSAGGCPFPTTDRALSPHQAEQLRVATLAPSSSLSASEVRPALGFSLDTTRRDEITSWARSHAIDCTADRHGAGLTCPDVGTSQLPKPTASALRGTLMFGFSPDARLVSVHYLSRDTSREKVVARATEATELLASLEAPVQSQGSLGLVRPLAQARRSVAFRNYTAQIAATHLGPAYLVSESYQSFGP